MTDGQTTVPVRLGEAAYEVTIAPGLLGRVGSFVAEVAPHEKALLAVDGKIAASHGRVAQESLEASGYGATTVHLVAEESYKTLETVHRIYEAVSAARLERGSPVVAVGGGIVGDTAGYAAATYLR